MAELTITNFDDTLYDAFCMKAAAQNRSVNELVVEALQRGFAEQVYPVKEDSQEPALYVNEEALAWPAETSEESDDTWDGDGFDDLLMEINERRKPWPMIVKKRKSSKKSLEAMRQSALEDKRYNIVKVVDLILQNRTLPLDDFAWRNEAFLLMSGCWDDDGRTADEIIADIRDNRTPWPKREEFA